MVIWRTDKIIEKYNNQEITNADKFAYYFSVSLISYFVNILWQAQLLNQGQATVQHLLIQMVIWIFGILYVYHKCKQGDPVNFIEKYFLLLLPATLRFIIFFYPVYIFIYTLIINPTENPTNGSLMFLWGISFVAWIVFYRYIGSKIQLMILKPVAP
jgi:hypothetical protein